VIDCGDKVKHGIKKGVIVLVDAAFTERRYCVFPDGDNPDGQEDFLCQDKYAFAIFRNKQIFPLGRRILIRRDMDEKLEKGIVVEASAQPSTDQSMKGTVVQFGILPRKLNKHKKPVRWQVNGIGIGDRIVLDKWSENWTEVSMDGVYYLIVAEADLLYKYD
jgi:co-chaperonin GroES (HSP10)